MSAQRWFVRTLATPPVVVALVAPLGPTLVPMAMERSTSALPMYGVWFILSLLGSIFWFAAIAPFVQRCAATRDGFHAPRLFIASIVATAFALLGLMVAAMLMWPPRLDPPPSLATALPGALLGGLYWGGIAAAAIRWRERALRDDAVAS